MIYISSSIQIYENGVVLIVYDPRGCKTMVFRSLGYVRLGMPICLYMEMHSAPMEGDFLKFRSKGGYFGG
jgi:hypothetical protein